jgi:hypothetical protein
MTAFRPSWRAASPDAHFPVSPLPHFPTSYFLFSLFLHLPRFPFPITPLRFGCLPTKHRLFPLSRLSGRSRTGFPISAFPFVSPFHHSATLRLSPDQTSTFPFSRLSGRSRTGFPLSAFPSAAVLPNPRKFNHSSNRSREALAISSGRSSTWRSHRTVEHFRHGAAAGTCPAQSK